MIWPSLRSQVLDDLRKGYVGVVKMKSLAQSQVWLPGIDQDKELFFTKSCAGCQAVNFMNPMEWMKDSCSHSN